MLLTHKPDIDVQSDRCCQSRLSTLHHRGRPYSWCYGRPQHSTNPCAGNVPDKFIVPQYTDELWQLRQPQRPPVARHLAPCPLSEDSLVSTALGSLCADARAPGWLSAH